MPKLSKLQKRLVLHWGEMGPRWGINRTVAQIHALLYLAPEPLSADQIADALSVSRSNVSTSLRELQAWGIVNVRHKLGDRRDYFESLDDVWEMFELILEERKRREIDPTLGLLRELHDEADRPGSKDPFTRSRIASVLEFFESAVRCYQQMKRLGAANVVRLASMGTKLDRLLRPTRSGGGNGAE